MVKTETFRKRKRKGVDNIDYPDIQSSRAPRFYPALQQILATEETLALSQESCGSVFQPEGDAKSETIKI